MAKKSLEFYSKQAIIFSDGAIPKNAAELIDSQAFGQVMTVFLQGLKSSHSSLLTLFPNRHMSVAQMAQILRKLLRELSFKRKEDVVKDFPHFAPFFSDIYRLDQLVESLYNFWRHYERFFILCRRGDIYASGDDRPYRTFNQTVESLTHLIRGVYRDIRENITGDHPRVYRQVAAGCQMGIIAKKNGCKLPKKYQRLKNIPIIRQIYMVPPLIFDPPMNKREGFFQKVESNPLDQVVFKPQQWLCYPAKVFDTIILAYFNIRFISLGMSLANLFELADEEDLKKPADAIYAFGVERQLLQNFADQPTVFYDDSENNMLIAAVPDGEEFGYFGYLKKMMLTLHNVIAMKKNRLPVHGAMVRLRLINGKTAHLLIWGDSGAGKSETLEALRVMAPNQICEMNIIFDDMGSLEITEDGSLLAYGTEIGAFVRLDDLHPGFAFGNMDRAIIHSPQRMNARAIIPITSKDEIERGYPIDFLLYANNYEEIDEEMPILERIDSYSEALAVFRRGARMAKGTTGEKGLTHSYFANPFGPVQYRESYEMLAEYFFREMFARGIFVGQLRTRLGIPGYEIRGPQEAAKELLHQLSKVCNG